MTDVAPLPFDLPAVASKKLTVDFDGGKPSSDAGLQLLRAAEARLVWRGDSHCGRNETMTWCEEEGDCDYIFGFAGNSVLDAMVAATVEHLKFWHAISEEPKLRCCKALEYEAGSRPRARRIVARIEVSLQPDPAGDGLKQAVDIRYVVPSLDGRPEHLYEAICCQRGQAENLLKLPKVQCNSNRTSCHSATANQLRLVLATAAFWLLRQVRSAIPSNEPLAKAEFATIRQRLIKIAARVIERGSRIRIHLPTSCPERSLFRRPALGVTPLVTCGPGRAPRKTAARGRSTPSAWQNE